MTNPPFNMKEVTSAARRGERWPYGPPPADNDNFAWLQYVISCLREGGRAAVIMPQRAANSTNSVERDIRKNMAGAGVVECVLALPPRLFSGTSVPVSIWILKSPDPDLKEVFFVDATKVGVQRRGRRFLDEDSVAAVVEVYRAWQIGGLGDLKTSRSDVASSTATKEGISKRSWSLNPLEYAKPGKQRELELENPLPRVIQEIANREDAAIRTDSAARQIYSSVLARYPDTWHGPPGRWESRTLAEICEIQPGPSPSRLSAGTLSSSGEVRVVLTKHLKHGGIQHNATNGITQDLAGELSKFRLRNGDIIFGRAGVVGQPAVVTAQEEGWILGTNVTRLRLRGVLDVDSRYLCVYLSSPKVTELIRARAAGTTVPTISSASLGSLLIAVPPIEDQVEITAMLDAVRAQVTAHQNFATAVARAHTVMMEQLFR